MAFAHVGGLDHAVIMVESLERAAAQWAALGFTVSPKGVHSAHVGAANHTVVLEGDYIELLGILRETESNAPAAAFLRARGSGIERFALATGNAQAAADELRAAGLAATGPFSFGRPVPLPDGATTEARFRIARWPAGAAPAGVRLFVCEHVTPEAVWRPELQGHANSATRILRLEIVAREPGPEARELARLTGRIVSPQPEGAFLVPTTEGRASVVLAPRGYFTKRYPAVPAAAIPEQGALVLVLGVKDRAAAARALGAAAHRTEGRLYVPPAMATGAVIAFE
ncbi:MAG: VOC family protein [Alphaproteobacteria bacterium]|nr:VOC family protein [Alphaproteobacteria bacterium]